MYYSKGGADMKRRISRTAKFGYDIGSLGAFHEPDGEMTVTAVKTRMAHAGVRHMLPKSVALEGRRRREHPDQPARHPRHLAQPADVGDAVDEEVGPGHPGADADVFLHSWQVAAHMLGVRDEYIPATWDAADAQAPQILDPVLAPTHEGIKLADILLNLGAEADGGVVSRPMLESLTRYFCGDRIADWLQIPAIPDRTSCWPPAGRSTSRPRRPAWRCRSRRTCTGPSTRSSGRARCGTSATDSRSTSRSPTRTTRTTPDTYPPEGGRHAASGRGGHSRRRS